MRSEDSAPGDHGPFGRYEALHAMLRRGIALYIARGGQTPEDDARLCWLALRAGELAHAAKHDVAVAFEWARERPLDERSRMQDAVARLSVLDGEELFKAALLLLWIDVDRQADLPEEQRSDEGARQVLEAVEERIPAGSGTIDWREFLYKEFMAWLALRVVTVLPLVNVCSLVARTSETASLTRLLTREISESGHRFNEGQIALACSMSEAIEDPWQRVEAQAALGDVVARAGQPKHAAGVVRSALAAIPALKLAQSHALLQVVRVISQHENIPLRGALFQQAAETAEAIGHGYQGLAAVSGVAEELAHVGEVADRRSILPQLLAAVHRIEHVFERERCHALLAVAEALVVAGEPEHARDALRSAVQTAHALDGMGEKSEALSRIAGMLGRLHGFPDRENALRQVETAFRQMLQMALEMPDGFERDHALQTVARASLQPGRLMDRPALAGEVLTAVRSMSDVNSRATTLAGIADVLERAGQVQSARDVLREALASAYAGEVAVLEPRILAGIARSQVRCGELEQARATARLALEVADREQEDDDFDVYDYGYELLPAIAEALLDAGEVDRSRDVFRRAVEKVLALGDDDEKSKVLSDIARAVAQAETLPDRSALFGEVVEATRTIERNSTRAWTLVPQAEVLARAHDMPDRVALFQQLLTAARAVSMSKRAVAFEGIAKAVGDVQSLPDRVGLFHQLLAAAGTLEPGDLDYALAIALGLRGLAPALAQAREFDQALALADAVEYDLAREAAFESIADALVQAGEPARARAALHRVRAVAAGSEARLSALALRFARLGDVEQARETFRQGLAEPRTLHGCGAAPDVQERVVLALAHAGDVGQAARALRFFDLDSTRVLPEIARVLGRHGRMEDALSTVEDIEDGFTKCETLCAVAHLLLEAREHDHARDVVRRAMEAARIIPARIHDGVAETDAVRAIAQIRAAPVLAQTGQVAQAREILRQALTAACSLGATGVLVDIASILADMENLPRREDLVHDVLRAHSLIDDEASKYGFLLRLARVLSGAESLSRRDAIFRDLLAAASELGGWATIARELLASIAVPAILRTVARAGAHEQLLEIVHRAAEMASAIRTNRQIAQHSINLVLGVAQVLASDDGGPRRHHLLRELATGAARIVPHDSRSALLTGIARWLAHAGDLAQAHELLEQGMEAAEDIETDDAKGQTLVDIANVLAQAETLSHRDALFREVYASARALRDRRHQFGALRGIAEALAHAAELPDRAALLQGTLTALHDVGEVQDRAKALAGVADTLVRAGDSELAREVLQHALETAGAVEREDEKTSVLLIIVQSSAALRMPEIVHRFAESAGLSDASWRELLPQWRKSLLDQTADPVPWLRQSLRYHPFWSETACEGVRMLQLAHLQAGNRETFDAISRDCPQLGLSFLLGGGMTASRW